MKTIELTDRQAEWLYRFLFYGTDGMWEDKPRDRAICDRITQKIREIV